MATLLCLLAASAFAKNGFLGQPGTASPETSGSVGVYLEESAPAPKPETAPKDEAAPAPAPAQVQAKPQEAAPRTAVVAAPRPEPLAAKTRKIGGFVMRDPASQRRYAASQPRSMNSLSDAVADRPAAAARPAKLWESVGAPIEMTPEKLSKAGLDDAQGAANDEYERRILGGAGQPKRPSGELPPPPAAGSPGQLFVSVEMSLAGESALKDAVADFSRATGFTADPRFPARPALAPYPSTQRRVAVTGWLPTERLGEAARASGVTRLEVEHAGPRLGLAPQTRTSLLVGLRMPVQTDAGQSFQRIIAELSASADLRWRRTIGFQNLPGTTDVALVIAADVPVTRIPKVLEHPAVLKIVPAPVAADALPPAAEDGLPWRFARYARRQAPLLALATLIALLPLPGMLKRR